MPLISSDLKRRLLGSYKVNRLRTWYHQQTAPCHTPRIVWLFGCQRSGTTLLRDFIGLDPRVNDQGEGDPPFFHQTREDDPRYLRLVDTPDIRNLVERQRSEIVLIKPLHDSQRARELLELFPTSKGLWIFRDYREVVLSHITYYRGRYEPMEYLGDLFELSDGSWKSSGLGEPMREFVRQNRHLATTPEIGFAIFWLARNSLFFDQEHPRLKLISYRGLVERAPEAVGILGNHIELELERHAGQLPETRKRSHKVASVLPEVIRKECEEMMIRLENAAML